MELRKKGKEELLIDVAFIYMQLWKMRCERAVGKRCLDSNSTITRI